MYEADTDLLVIFFLKKLSAPELWIWRWTPHWKISRSPAESSYTFCAKRHYLECKNVNRFFGSENRPPRRDQPVSGSSFLNTKSYISENIAKSDHCNLPLGKYQNDTFWIYIGCIMKKRCSEKMASNESNCEFGYVRRSGFAPLPCTVRLVIIKIWS